VKMTTNDVFAPFLYTLPFLYIVNQDQIEANTNSDGQYGDNGDYGTAWLGTTTPGAAPTSSRNATDQAGDRHREQRRLVGNVPARRRRLRGRHDGDGPGGRDRGGAACARARRCPTSGSRSRRTTTSRTPTV